MTLRPINVTTPAQSNAIRVIEPSYEYRDGSESVVVRPCAVTLTDGTVLERAFLNEFVRYSDAGDWINPEIVAGIRTSPHALPRELVAKLNAAGESGMGYLIYKLHFRDQPDLVVVAGNFNIDFPDLPEGYEMRNAIGVTPHAGRERTNTRGGYCQSHSAPFIDFVFHDDPRAASHP